jgi:RNA polymerase sigma-70 factor (ECF subfamily)
MGSLPTEDHKLLQQLQRGNEAAFNALYRRYQGPIYRFAWHMSGNRANAEEVTQEVFMRLIGNPKMYDSAKGSLGNYLFGIARNVVHRQMERSGPPLTQELPDAEEGGPATEVELWEQIDRQELLECLRKSLLALPEQYREAVVLCDMEEMSYPEAAEVLQCPPGTVASRLHRARSMLKARLLEMGCVR